MNKTETMKILAVLQVNFPDSFKSMTSESKEAVVNLWYTILADDSYQDVQAAVLAHIATDTSRFMPPVGVIKQMIVKLKTPDDMTEAEAWALVASAIRRSAYYSRAEFDKLPPVCQRLVGSPEQLREWAISDNFNSSVIQSNFMRSYKVRLQQEKDFIALPSAVKETLKLTSNNMSLLNAINN